VKRDIRVVVHPHEPLLRVTSINAGAARSAGDVSP
jgi:hypothetical protein